MNKTLLLILCDFLLITLISLVDWEKVDAPAPKPAAPPAAAGPVRADADLLESLRLSLEAGQADRERLAASLADQQNSLQQRDRNLDRLRSEVAAREEQARLLAEQKGDLENTLTEARRSIDTLSQKYSATADEAALARARLQLAQEELQRRQAEAERLSRDLGATAEARARAEEEARSLGQRIQVVEAEKNLLRENISTLQSEVQVQRREKEQLTQQTGRLAEGVSQLAERSADLREEIRSNRPISANALFSEVLAARVTATVTATRPGLIGPVRKTAEARTLLVSDGQDICAILHLKDTPWSVLDTYTDWDAVAVTLSGPGGRSITVQRLCLLSADPRVLIAPLPLEDAAALGARVYRLAPEPFKFPEAVLISPGGRFYGEVEFKLDARNPRFVRMPSSIINRIVGDFSPSQGDLVLSKDGGFLGVMVNDSHCVLVDNFLPSAQLDLTQKPPSTAALLRLLRERYDRLPSFLK